MPYPHRRVLDLHQARVESQPRLVGTSAFYQPLQRLSMKERARVYRAPDGHRVLGMIRPIHNEPGCSSAACHAHAPSPLFC